MKAKQQKRKKMIAFSVLFGNVINAIQRD